MTKPQDTYFGKKLQAAMDAEDAHAALAPVVIDQLYVVRLWDGFDGEWMDVSGPLSKDDAETLAGDKNAARIGSGAGNRNGNYNEIDYYKAFPADTKMLFADGNSQTRGDQR